MWLKLVFWVFLVYYGNLTNNDIMWHIPQTSVSTKGYDSTTAKLNHTTTPRSGHRYMVFSMITWGWESNTFWGTKLFHDFLWAFWRVFNHTSKNQFQDKPRRDFLWNFSNGTHIINHKMSHKLEQSYTGNVNVKL